MDVDDDCDEYSGGGDDNADRLGTFFLAGQPLAQELVNRAICLGTGFNCDCIGFWRRRFGTVPQSILKRQGG